MDREYVRSRVELAVNAGPDSPVSDQTQFVDILYSRWEKGRGEYGGTEFDVNKWSMDDLLEESLEEVADAINYLMVLEELYKSRDDATKILVKHQLSILCRTGMRIYQLLRSHRLESR